MQQTAWVPSDQPHEAAPGWVWWCGAAISRYFYVQPKKYYNNAIFVNTEAVGNF